MVRALIIDDESDARRSLRQMLDRYCPEVEVIGEADGVGSGVALIREEQPDVIFLDIQMQDGSGFDLLSHFPEPRFGIIFSTAFDQFALKAFQFNAIDYLLKPTNPEELRRAVRKVQEKVHRQQQYARQVAGLVDAMQRRKLEKISLSTNEGLIFLRLKKLLRLEADGSYTTCYTQDGRSVMVARSLRDFEALLPEDMFFRTHQSHMVNLYHVQSILKEDGGCSLMADGAKVPISRRKKDAFLKELARISL